MYESRNVSTPQSTAACTPMTQRNVPKRKPWTRFASVLTMTKSIRNLLMRENPSTVSGLFVTLCIRSGIRGASMSVKIVVTAMKKR
jgi:hypothetical protein